MSKKTITVYSDAGHAWAKIKRSELLSLGILKDISHYSYQRSNFVYLEEDQDLSLYVDALKKTEPSIEIKFNIHNSEYSRIRSYENFYLKSGE